MLPTVAIDLPGTTREKRRVPILPLVLLGVHGKVMNMFGVVASSVRLVYPSVVSNFLMGRSIRLAPPVVIDMIVANAIAVGGWIALWRRSQRDNVASRATVLAAIVLCFVLASPFTGLQVAGGRLSMMAYLPAAVVLAFLLAHLRSLAATGLVLVVTVLSALATIPPVSVPCIPNRSYAELCQLGQYVDSPEKTLIIARHGLE